MRGLRGILLFVFILCIGFVLGASVFVSPGSKTVNQGDTFTIFVKANATETDIYGVQFDVSYNSAYLDLVSVSEGDFLSEAGNVSTIFNYTTSANLIDNLYLIRNVSGGSGNAGVYGEGVLVELTFYAKSVGTTSVNLDNLIWINSSITNYSVGEPAVNLTNFTVTINSEGPVNTGSSSGGGGGGGSYSPPTTNETNESVVGTNSGQVNFEIVKNDSGNETENETFESLNDSEESGGGFLALTGQVIGNTARTVFSSWVFYFVLGLGIIFVVVLFLRKKYYGGKSPFVIRKKGFMPRSKY